MEKLKYIYYSIFYNFYRILKKIDSDEMPQTGALFILAFLENLNLLVFLELFSEHIFGLNMQWIVENSKLFSLPVFIFLTGINYLIFLKEKKYLKIEIRFSKELKSKLTQGYYFTAIYVLLSLFAFIYFYIY